MAASSSESFAFQTHIAPCYAFALLHTRHRQPKDDVKRIDSSNPSLYRPPRALAAADGGAVAARVWLRKRAFTRILERDLAFFKHRGGVARGGRIHALDRQRCSRTRVLRAQSVQLKYLEGLLQEQHELRPFMQLMIPISTWIGC
ncbi:unnamed protein product [Urochloa humidicola]